MSSNIINSTNSASVIQSDDVVGLNPPKQKVEKVYNINWIDETLRDTYVLSKSLHQTKTKDNVLRYKDVGIVNLIHHDLTMDRERQYNDYIKVISIVTNSAKRFTSDNLKDELLNLLTALGKYVGNRVPHIDMLMNFLKHLMYITDANALFDPDFNTSGSPEYVVYPLNDINSNDGMTYDEFIKLHWMEKSDKSPIPYLIDKISQISDDDNYRIRTLARCYFNFLENAYMTKQYHLRTDNFVVDLNKNINKFIGESHGEYLEWNSKMCNKVGIKPLEQVVWLETIYYKLFTNGQYNLPDELAKELNTSLCVNVPALYKSEDKNDPMLRFIGMLNQTQRYFRNSKVYTGRYHNMFYFLYRPSYYSLKLDALKVQLGSRVDLYDKNTLKDTHIPYYIISRETKTF